VYEVLCGGFFLQTIFFGCGERERGKKKLLGAGPKP
jgi:hypothetical protein